eukprot:evm.model.scf_1353EXC.2 EVM.evm.TU.scf_1353EXC.2   scf_1353EXC:22172-32618(-)
MWVLVPLEGSGADGPYYLACGHFTIGRHVKGSAKQAADIVIRDAAVSKRHAEVCVEAVEGGGRLAFRLRDLSKFGTQVDGTKLGKDFVAAGDGNIIQLAKSKFRLEWQPFRLCVGGEDTDMDVLNELIEVTGGCLLPRWDPSCTHVELGDGQVATPAAACGLLKGKPLVTPEWARDMLRSRLAKGGLTWETHHCPNRCRAEAGGGCIAIRRPADGCRPLLEGMYFAWPEKQYADGIQRMVALAGGHNLKGKELKSRDPADCVAVRRGGGPVLEDPNEKWRRCTNEARLVEGVLLCDASIILPPTVATDDDDTTDGESEGKVKEEPQTIGDSEAEDQSRNAQAWQGGLGERKREATAEAAQTPSKRRRRGQGAAGDDALGDEEGGHEEEAGAKKLRTSPRVAKRSALEVMSQRRPECAEPARKLAGWDRRPAEASRKPAAGAQKTTPSASKPHSADEGQGSGKGGGGAGDDGLRNGGAKWRLSNSKRGGTEATETGEAMADGLEAPQAIVDQTLTVVMENLLVSGPGMNKGGGRKVSVAGSNKRAASGIPGAPNFKAFKKVVGMWGRGRVVVPFSQEPYRESMVDGEMFLREARERHMREKAAEDLFKEASAAGGSRGRGRGRGGAGGKRKR